MSRWATLDQAKIDEFMDSDGIINEFALLYKLRSTFPLHYIVFKQVSSHLPHEANTEQLFSVAGNLSDDNGKVPPKDMGLDSVRPQGLHANGQGHPRALHGKVQQGWHGGPDRRFWT